MKKYDATGKIYIRYPNLKQPKHFSACVENRKKSKTNSPDEFNNYGKGKNYVIK